MTVAHQAASRSTRCVHRAAKGAAGRLSPISESARDARGPRDTIASAIPNKCEAPSLWSLKDDFESSLRKRRAAGQLTPAPDGASPFVSPQMLALENPRRKSTPQLAAARRKVIPKSRDLAPRPGGDAIARRVRGIRLDANETARRRPGKSGDGLRARESALRTIGRWKRWFDDASRRTRQRQGRVGRAMTVRGRALMKRRSYFGRHSNHRGQRQRRTEKYLLA